MLSQEVQVAIDLAQHVAMDRRHSIVTLEHLLFALLHDPETIEVVEHSGGDVTTLKSELKSYLDEEVDSVPDQFELELTMSLGFQRAIRRAILHVQGSRMDSVKGFNILIAIYAEQESFAKYFLENNKVDRLDVVSYVSHGVSKLPVPVTETHGFERPHEEGGEGEGSKEKRSLLQSFAVNLNDLAAAGKIDPLVGRKKEVDRLIHVLSRRRKNNPVLVGDSGVGKTAIVEGLARKIHEGEVPDAIKDAVVWSLDMGVLVAGTKYRGDFEERLKGVVEELKALPDAVLFIDEIHTIIRAGATEGGSMDASNLLKPALQNGDLRCIGSTTFDEYRKHFERDRALARRFQKIDVDEPSVADTVKILTGLKPRYEEFHKVRYTRGAILAAAELAAKHMRELRLPDKAIDLIDEAGAANRLRPANRRKETVSAKDIQNILATMAKIPPQQVTRSDRDALATLEGDLKRMIYGQDNAVQALVAAIKMSRSGIGNEDKPQGSFMFTGPTGVGKTELARQLALHLGIQLHRFDMSEYTERHSVSRLIGSPPGYVGYNEGGQLTEAITKSPHCVILLDEIEKAHFQIYNVLLQVMDHGTLTDNQGRHADFRNAIIIMTSNVGAREVAKGGIGFGSKAGAGDDTKAYERAFSPEFRNRLDARVRFAPLDESIMGQIVDKFLSELQGKLDSQRVTLTVSEAARELLGQMGYDPAMGARPLARVIKEQIKRPLSEELLFGKLEKGGEVIVDVVDGKLTFQFPGDAE
ncbi:MAG: ATP-dependent Clp protease ATP-binding subunit ClpA [Myxococcota bacterium]|jgi:ATP-dependent Clp protease ATP-binding subunit ClpA